MIYTSSTLDGDTRLREVAMLCSETDPKTQRLKFVQDALSDRFTMAEVCAPDGKAYVPPNGYSLIRRWKSSQTILAEGVHKLKNNHPDK